MEIKIRAFKNSDIDGLIAQGLTDSSEAYAEYCRAYWEWITSFQPQERIFLLACLGDKIIGYFGMNVSRLKIENQIIKGYHGSLFIHPDHRKKTYSYLTLNSLVKRMRDEVSKNDGVIYGFPIPRLVTLYKRAIGLHTLKPSPRYVHILNLLPLLERIVRNKSLSRVLWHVCQPLWRLWLFRIKDCPKDITVKKIHFFDERFNALWKMASKTHKIIATRDATYLNWRYTKEPGQRYIIFAAEKNDELLGYVILK